MHPYPPCPDDVCFFAYFGNRIDLEASSDFGACGEPFDM
jgi:hypothetical protein